MEATKVQHAKGELIVTVRLAGSVNSMTLKRHATTGNDFVDAVLKQYKKNHVKHSYKADDIIGVMNVRTLRFLRLSNKLADQTSSDMLWLITYDEWQEYRKSLEFDKPVTRRTAVMVPQHPSGLSEDKKKVFVEKYDVFQGEGDAESTLKSAIDGIETRSRDDIMTYLGSKHRLSILDIKKDSAAKRAIPSLTKESSPTSTGAKTVTVSDSGDSGKERAAYNTFPPSIARGLLPASGPISDRNVSPPSFLEVSTPFIRRLTSARDRDRPKRMPAGSRAGARDQGYTEEADDEGYDDEDEEDVPVGASPTVSVSMSSITKVARATPMTTSKASLAPRTPAQGPSSAQAQTGARTRPSVMKSVTLSDLGTHHYSSASDGEGDGESIKIRSPSVTSGVSPLQQEVRSPLVPENGRRGSLVSLRDGGGDSGDGVASLRALLRAEGEDVVLAAIPRHQVPHLRNLASLEKTVLPDYSAVVRHMMLMVDSGAGTGGDGDNQGELEGQLAYHVQALEAERKANEINLRALRAEHQTVVSQISQAHEQVMQETRQDYDAALAQAESKAFDLKNASESTLETSAASVEEKMSSLQQLLEFERQTNLRREGKSEEALRTLRETSKAEKADLEAKLAELKLRQEQELVGMRESLQAKQNTILEHESGVYNAQKTALQDKVAALEELLDEARLAGEQQKQFLVNKADEQKATLERLLEEERAASSRALQSHRDASDQRLATLRQHADGTIEYKLKMAEEQALVERQGAEERIQAVAQDHALAMEAARKAADERYAYLETHHTEVLETAKKSAETRIDALKRLVEEERGAAQDKMEIAVQRHAKELTTVRENEEAARRAQAESHKHKEQMSRARQEDLLARLDSVRSSFETKLTVQKRESEDNLVREKAHLEAKITQLTDQHVAETHSLRDSHTQKVGMLQEAQREHADRAAVAEERLAAAAMDHKKTLDLHKEGAEVRLARLRDSHSEALQEREQASILQQDQTARREKELHDVQETVVAELRDSLEMEKEKFQRLSELHRVVKRQTEEMVEAVAEPLRSKLADREAEVAVLQAGHKEAVEDVLMRAKSEHEAALAVHKDRNATMLETKKSEILSLQQHHESALQSLQFIHAEAVASHKAEMATLIERHQGTLVALRKAHAEDLEAKEREKTALLQRHEAALGELEKQIQDTSSSHSSQLEALKAAHRDSVQALHDDHDSRLSSLKEAHEKFLVEASSEHDKKLESLTSRLSADHEGVRQVHEKTLSFQQERLQQYISSYEDLKAGMEAKMTRMREAVEESQQAVAAKDEELEQTARRIKLQDEMLSVHDQASAAHKNDHEAAKERYLKLQRQHDEATQAAKDTKAFITARFEERLVTVQTQLNEEKERSTQRLAALDREHREAMESLQAQEARRRAAIEEEHSEHVERLKTSLDSHLRTEQETIKKKHSMLGDAHQSEISSLKASYDSLLAQERTAAETERKALLTRLQIAESSAEAEKEALKTEYDKQVSSVMEQQQRALETIKTEMAHLAESKATEAQATHAAEVSALNRQAKERLAEAEKALRRKEEEMAELSTEHAHRLDFVQKQMQRAIEAEGTDLVSITSPAVKMQHDAINSSVASHLSVDDDDNDDDDDGAKSGPDTENSTSDDDGDGAAGWAVPPIDARLQQLSDLLAVDTGKKRVSFSTGGGAGTSPGGGADGSPETTQTPSSSSSSSSSTSPGMGMGSSSMDDVDALELDPAVLKQRLSEVHSSKWKLEVQRDAMQLKLRVVERKYQRLITSLETKISNLKDLHARSKEMIHTGYERRLRHGNRQQQMDTEEMHASHAAEKARSQEVLESKHSEILRDHLEKHAEMRVGLQKENAELEERRREVARATRDKVNAQEKALFAAQGEFAAERTRLQTALTKAEEENKNLVAAVEEFRVMLLTGKRYESKDSRFVSPRKGVQAAGSGTGTGVGAGVMPGSGSTGRHNQYTNLFRWVTETIDDPAEKLLARTSPSPFRIQRWKAAQETARKRAAEKRERGETVDDDEIAETAYMEYYKGLESGSVPMDMAYYDPKASDAPSPRAQAALDEKLTLPVIYDTVVPDGEEGFMSNPMKMAVTRPPTTGTSTDIEVGGSSGSPSTPKGGQLPPREQLVLQVEDEIENARSSWTEELRALEDHYLSEMEVLKGQIAALRTENEKLPGLERELSRTIFLLSKNRELALKWVAKKHERNRMERSAKKMASIWAHHKDTRHWADVNDRGHRTPSRSERRRQVDSQKKKESYGFW